MSVDIKKELEKVAAEIDLKVDARVAQIKNDMKKQNENSILDYVQSKIVSRKLLVFLVATGLVITSALDAETWAMIAAMYIGGQSVIDCVSAWRHGG